MELYTSAKIIEQIEEITGGNYKNVENVICHNLNRNGTLNSRIEKRWQILISVINTNVLDSVKNELNHTFQSNFEWLIYEYSTEHEIREIIKEVVTKYNRSINLDDLFTHHLNKSELMCLFVALIPYPILV